MIALVVPTQDEIRALLGGAKKCRGLAVADGAAPPPFLLERGLGPDTTRWESPRLFVDEAERAVVGSGCFKTKPNGRRVEIGYGVAPMLQGRGYATGGVGLMVDEALGSGEVDEVQAATLPANKASVRVLMKLGFVVYGEGMDEEGAVELWRVRKAGLDHPEITARACLCSDANPAKPE